MPNPGALYVVRKFFPQVTTLRDAKQALMIYVAPSDVAKGKAKIARECALAKACKRQLRADGVIVNLSVVYVIKGQVATRYRPTEAISREIVSFDRNNTFSPGSYQISPFSPALTLNKLRGKKRKPVSRQRHKSLVISPHRTVGVRRWAAQ